MSEPQPASSDKGAQPTQPPRKRRFVILCISALFLGIGALLFCLWLFIWRFEKTTRDAYVHGNQVVVRPQIMGNIIEVTVDDTDLVQEGQLLVKLDTTDRQIALSAAKNQLAMAVRTVASLYEEIGTLKARCKRMQAELIRTASDYRHRKGVVEAGGVSVEEFEHAKTALISAFASYVETQYQLRQLLTQTQHTTLETHPEVMQAKELVTQTFVDLQRCQIRAPVKGMVSMKTAQVGESIDPTTPLMTLVPLDQIWINANFKEDKLKKVRIGQMAKIQSDIYGSGVIYQGEVVGIEAATGSVLSVLPPQNATGNWIKILQRLPVRIKLDPEAIARHPLRLGLSTKVTIDIRDTSGRQIPKPKPETPLYTTPIFESQVVGAQEIIEKIIDENSAFHFPINPDGETNE